MSAPGWGSCGPQEPAERSMATQTSPWGSMVGLKDSVKSSDHDHTDSKWHEPSTVFVLRHTHGAKAGARSHFPYTPH